MKYKLNDGGDGEVHETKSFGTPRTQRDGSITYPKKGWEPPPEIEGYTRDPRNKWRFIRKWLPCKSRQETKLTKPCGAIQIVALCECKGCPMYSLTVRAVDCEACPHINK